MDTKELIQDKITELDNNFDKLILINKLNINSIVEKFKDKIIGYCYSGEHKK